MRFGRILVGLVVLITAGGALGAVAARSGAQTSAAHTAVTATTAPAAHLVRRFAVTVGDDQSNNTPAVGNGAVFTTACNGTACSLTRRSLTTGAVAWRAAVGAHVLSPRLAGTAVVVATPTTIVAFDAADGHRRWSRAAASLVTQLSGDGQRVVAAEAEGEDIEFLASIEVFDVANGNRLWTKAQGTWSSDEPLTVAGGVVYANHSIIQSWVGVDEYAAGTGQFIRRVAKCHVGVFANGLLYDGASACNPVTGAIVWQQPGTGGSPAVDAHQLVVPVTVGANHQPALRAYDVQNGHPQWTRPVIPSGASGFGLPTLAGGVVYASTASYPPPGTYRRTLSAFRRSDGVLLATVSVPGSAGPQIAPHVAVASGVVFLQAAGVLYAYSA